MHTESDPTCPPDAGWYHDRRYRVFKQAKAEIGHLLGYFEARHSHNGHTVQTVAGQEVINFSGYDYLSLSRHPEVQQATLDAVSRYGSSAGASRLVSGETPLHQALERRIADFLGVERALGFVSGHGANVTTIGFLFGKNDLILHDAYIHNSVLEGIKLSGAERRSFNHNDIQDLEEKLKQTRHFKHVLVVIEGVYSMDGDAPDLRAIVALKAKYDFVLMVDEAHSLGTVGETGRGIAEMYRVPPEAIDILMGTLSKSLVSCGGYIAGRRDLIDFLQYNCPGFVFSTGLPPANAAAALAALDIIDREPELVEELQDKARYFLNQARAAGLDTGTASGTPVFPIYLDQQAAILACNALREGGVNAFPIIYPAVSKNAARIRFFLNRAHSHAQIDKTIRLLSSYLRTLSDPGLAA